MKRISEKGFGVMHIGGQDRAFHIGTYQSKKFCDLRQIEYTAYFEELAKFTFENSLSNNVFLCDLLYSALVAGCAADGMAADFTVDQVTFWADAAEKDELAKLFVVMAELNKSTPKK